MFAISKILTRFILPPGLFFLLLAAGVFLLLINRRKAGLKLLIITAAALYVLSIQPVADALIKPLESGYIPFRLDGAEEDSEDAGYIVLLGGGSICSSPEEGGKGSLQTDSFKRTVYAARVAIKTSLPVITSGSAVYSPEKCSSEAEVMAALLEELGVPANMIFEEGLSRNTFENAALTRARYNLEKVILVTSAYHMRRSVFCFVENGMEVIPAPTDYKRGNRSYDFYSFLPGIGSLYNSYTALHEYVGIVYYRLRY
jgi:uncharacterized SAM-binding protein YcdF (DUF218 family)